MSLKSSDETSKVLRLVEYLTRLASLRTKIIRDVTEYQNVLWIKDVPRQKGCFTQAWGCDEEVDSDVWVEVQTRRQPQLPTVPSLCKDWIDQAAIRNKSDIPDLLPQIVKQVENRAWQKESDQPEFITRTERLSDHPEAQRAWDQYVEECWLPWVEAHNNWETINDVYSKLFAIHQEQLRLGEEYELVLALGLLTWQTPSGQRVRRHLIVANAVLEFEARLGKFTLRPLPDGVNVRPELDMLDIEEQPVRAEETAKSSLANSGDDPWDRACIEGVLQAIVHSIDAQGEYDNRLEVKSIRVLPTPIVEYAPALILRKRSTRGLTETLKRIKERIENGGDIPAEFGGLAEIPPGSDVNGVELENEPGKTNRGFDGELYFPKPSNEEQRRIVEKIGTASGVLVQGPPGTGKSHTIANLICHLLATGKRILVTAKTPRALKVLEEELLPTEFRPLCINLLGSGLEDKRSLESSVGGILRKNEEWNESKETVVRNELQKRLRNLREEKAKVERRVRDIRESETHSQSVADGTYRGTAARIAEAVNQARKTYEWFSDTAPLDKACPISNRDLQGVLVALRRFTPEKRQELSLICPDSLTSNERFTGLVKDEKEAIDEETRLTRGADERIAERLTRIDASAIKTILDPLADFQSERRRLGALPYPWMRDVLCDVMSGNLSVWPELHCITKDTIGSISPLVSVADGTSIDLPDNVNIRTLLEDVCKVKEHIENGGNLGWGPFRPRVVKERIHVLKTIRVSGRFCRDLDQLSVLANILRVRVECEKAWGFWLGRCEKTEGPYALQLSALKVLCDALESVLSLDELIQRCRENLQKCPLLSEPVWAEESQIDQLITSCSLALARQKKRSATNEIWSTEAPLATLVAKNSAHPVVGELVDAIRNRNVDGYSHAANKVQVLEEKRRRLQDMDEYISNLRRVLPKLTEAMERTYDDACWEKRIEELDDAWHWAQARFWVEEYIRKEDTSSLAKRVRQIEDESNALVAKLASSYAWSFCFSRLNDSHRRHMEAWRKHVNSLTKTGRGKRDFRYRQAAQRSLNECKDAVPAWVMPLHRVWDTVDPAPGMFDVVIVDEASQCGFEALPLFYLGQKVVIVGDDKQISPSGEFQDTTPINKLLDEYLSDFQFKEYFDVNVSLFDHGKLRYGTRRITLREHFRCMPEIIRFSNDLCYFDTPLIPLRQYGPDRLTPIEHVFVNSGYREGSTNRAVNRPEADAIVKKIAELCDDKRRYSGKTMGVVVLQGEAQASLIEEQLLERLGAEEIGRRRLVCGNPYSFQGDQRHIMFLSMVAATNERIGPLTKPADERRFNVAASRARDQMFLFHSVSSEDLSVSCLRRRLLEFFQNTTPSEIAGIDREELERRAVQDNRVIIKQPAPFESWFEVDVALELVRKNFQVSPQFEIAGKRIDLVIDGGKARLAVECDGDNWHGPDRYEEDMQRQRQLERCGWEFFRVRESAFYSNKEGALLSLWRALEERGIFPGASGEHQKSELDEDEEEYDEGEYAEVEGDDEEDDLDSQFADNFGAADNYSAKRAQEVTTSEIQDVIIRVLSKCPNQSCTINSITARVLKELGIVTRGNPRIAFERRVMRSLGILESQERIEKYKAKNRRVRLLKGRPHQPTLSGLFNTK